MPVVARAGRRIGQESLRLLLDLCEHDPPEIAGGVIADCFADAGRRLISSGALKPISNATVVTCRACHGDHPAEVEFDEQTRSHRHFCPEAGWVEVPPGDLKQFRLDFPWLLGELARALEVPRRSQPLSLVDDVLWEIGETRVERHRMTALFGRRLAVAGNLDRAHDALTNRVRKPPGIVFTTSHGLSIRTALPGGHRILPLRDCLSETTCLSIDEAIVAGVLLGTSGITEGPPPWLQHSADFGTLTIRGRTFVFRGRLQKEVLRTLHEAWRDGRPQVRTQQLLEDVGAGLSTKRIKDVFRKHPDWKDLIGYRDGYCWLKVEKD